MALPRNASTFVIDDDTSELIDIAPEVRVAVWQIGRSGAAVAVLLGTVLLFATSRGPAPTSSTSREAATPAAPVVAEGAERSTTRTMRRRDRAPAGVSGRAVRPQVRRRTADRPTVPARQVRPAAPPPVLRRDAALAPAPPVAPHRPAPSPPPVAPTPADTRDDAEEFF